jgi:hypothetical protein
MPVANLFARRAQPFAVGFLGAFHQATLRDAILDTREASDILNLVE